MKKILIDQPGFLGDIIFVMAIAQKYVKEGYVVDFPIFEEYSEISFQKYFPGINFIPIKLYGNYKNYCGNNFIEDDEYIFLPLRCSSNRKSYQHMKDKYDIIGWSFDNWRNIQIVRDYKAEAELFKILNLNVESKYNFINENHQRTFIKVPISVNNEFENVHMKKIDGFSIFDWIGIMERAQTIHTVGTSLVFLTDSIDTMPNEMHLYKRADKPHSDYDYLLKKTYIYHN